MAAAQAFDEALVARAQAGDDAARDELLRRLQPVLRAFFVSRVGARTEVDDLIQNTLLRVHGGLADLQHAGSLRGFALRAAVFELQDLYRGRYGPKEVLVDPDAAPEPSREDASVGTRVDLERALAELTPKARRILELREYGYRYEEIAGLVGSTEAAIKMQVKRAFEKLRTLLAVLLALLVS